METDLYLPESNNFGQSNLMVMTNQNSFFLQYVLEKCDLYITPFFCVLQSASGFEIVLSTYSVCFFIMGVEVVESNASLNVEDGSDTKMPAENGKVSIMFGSHGGEEPKAEANKVSESSLPKDAVDEWPEPKQIHSFYAVRYRPIEDQSLRAKQDVYDRELQKLNQARAQKVDQLKAKRVWHIDFLYDT